MTSFSALTKDALSVLPVKALHCRKAELSAIAACIGLVDFDEADRLLFVLQSESRPVMARADYLLRTLTDDPPEVSAVRGAGVRAPVFTLIVRKPETVKALLRDLGFLTAKGVLREFSAPAPFFPFTTSFPVLSSLIVRVTVQFPFSSASVSFISTSLVLSV